MPRPTPFSLVPGLFLISAVGWAAVVACGSDGEGSTFGGGADAGGGPSFPLTEAGGPVGPFTDFPAEPIIDTGDGGAGASGGTPANAAALFAAGGAEGGDGNSPCLLEPEIGAMVPRNWLRPRFRWNVAGDSNLFEIRLHADNQINDLVVYTTSRQWTLSKTIWETFREHSAGVPITIAVRGGTLKDGAVSKITAGSKGPWSIAKAEAPGSIVYWRIIGNSEAELKGFVVGDDGVRLALDPAKVEQEANTRCVGCHISSPDGKYAIFSSQNYGGGDVYATGIASIEPATEGKKPPFLTALGEDALEHYLKGITTVSGAHWGTGKHLVVGSWDGELRWVNLDGTTTETVKGRIERTGDTSARPNSPNLSHDGTRLVYIAAPEQSDGRPTGPNGDINVLPFNGGAGGASAKLAGAAEADFNEYYPSFSPDDRLVAFNRVPRNDGPYAAAKAELFVVPGGGGAAQRLSANDPPACSGKTSPGVENSWPKWAPAKPAPEVHDGKTYYWIIFSSTRFGGAQRQLFMAPVVVGADGKVESFKATYLWNQPSDEKNHTPAWDVFQIPSSGVN